MNLAPQVEEILTGSDIFAEYISEIKNPGIKELVIITLDRVGVANKYFFSAPASSTQKYHPSCSNVKPGGLVRHVYRAIEIGKHFSRALAFCQTDTDIVIAALILHDIWKNDFKHHASRASEEILSVIRANRHLFKLTSYEVLIIIAKCVLLHMGPWTEPKYKKSMAEYTLHEMVVYLADYLSSRKEISLPIDESSLNLVKSFLAA